MRLLVGYPAHLVGKAFETTTADGQKTCTKMNSPNREVAIDCTRQSINESIHKCCPKSHASSLNCIVHCSLVNV